MAVVFATVAILAHPGAAAAQGVTEGGAAADQWPAGWPLPAATPGSSFDPLFVWLESTSFHNWIVESPSLFAMPGILALHTIGLGLLAGLNGALDLRLLGVARGVPPLAFTRFLPVMWVGFWVNVATGVALLLGYPTKALTNPVFYLKLGLIAAAVLILRSVVRRVHGGDIESRATKILASASLLLWAAAITAGRLLAYTCNRLTVDIACR